jgi:REP-associated tyrosine transposase
MARHPRVFAPGLLYHVIARGNRREAVFLDRGDYETYLNRLAAYQIRYAVTLHAYCLMPNHVHLVARIADTPLDRFMQGLQQSYTQRYNRRHGQIGHVFQGRYKARVCGTDEYLVTLVRYVHLNPVRAGLAGRPEDYPYSGHRAYLEGSPGHVDPMPVLRLVGGVSGYKRLVEDAETDLDPEASPQSAGVQPPLGGPKEGLLTGPPRRSREPLERALHGLAVELRTHVDTLRGPDRSRTASRTRALAAFVLIRRLGYRVGDVATAIGRHETTTGILVGRLALRMPSSPELAQDVERLAKCMEVKA